MRRPAIVRLEVVLLVLAAVLLFGRMMAGPGRPDGLVAVNGLDPDQLWREAFAVEQPARLVVTATGSFERSGESGAGPLAAYAWIMRRDTREVVWRMTPQNVRPGRGTLAEAADTLRLAPGTYDAYFTTFGNRPDHHGEHSFWSRITDRRQHWKNDAREWMLALRPIGGEPVRLHRVGYHEEGHAEAPGVLWTSGPVHNRDDVGYLFEVHRPTTLGVYSVGQINGSPDDYSRIENAQTGEPVWEMTEENTEYAGGAQQNRVFRGDVQLEPGLYRAVYRAGDHHAYGSWQANPPYDPGGWGLTLTYTDPAASDAVSAFDPWSRPSLASIGRVPSDRMDKVQFRVDAPMSVYVYALGEMVDDHAYDYAWLENTDTGERVWEMDPDQARHAGGASKNRLETAFLHLDPGTYVLAYETDDSHAFDDWNDDPPEHPERWGVSIFPLNASQDSETWAVLDRQQISRHEDEEFEVGMSPDAPLPPLPPLPEGDGLVELPRMGNDSEQETAFHIERPTRIHIRALGEVTRRGQFDYGWIERQGSRERVWEMTWENTRPAGGDDRNRLFDGTVILQPGRYVVHFQTDMSHAFGDFGEFAPPNPEAWGITIQRVD